MMKMSKSAIFTVLMFSISTITTVCCEAAIKEYHAGIALTCYLQNETTLCLTLEGGHKCGFTLSDILWCDNGRLDVLADYCVTLDEESSLLEIGKCVYAEKPLSRNRRSDLSYYNKLPEHASELNEGMCEVFNRNGTLCGECKDGYFPLAYSYNMTCVECPNSKYNWWKYVLAAFLPLTVFYFIILFFKINITSSHLHGFILFSHAAIVPQLQRLEVVALPNKTFMLNSMRCFVALYAIWNLDFFRVMPLNICLGIDTLPTLALDLAVGVYPLLLILVSYLMIKLYDRNFTPLVVMWRPFSALFDFLLKNVDIRTSLIDSFATFFLLSNMKFLNAVFDLLVPVRVHQVPLSDPFNVTVSWRLYYDASIPYLGKTHLPYAILAIVVLIILVLFPMLIILLYPFRWFQKLMLNIFPIQWNIILHTFVDAFLGCYKDGTEPGTHDCRWFAATFLILRPVFILIGAITLNEMFFIIAAMLIISMIIALINIEPFKANMHRSANVNIIFLLSLAIWYLCLIGKEYSFSASSFTYYGVTGVTFVGFITLLYLSAVIIHWIFTHTKFHLKMISARRRSNTHENNQFV